MRLPEVIPELPLLVLWEIATWESGETMGIQFSHPEQSLSSPQSFAVIVHPEGVPSCPK